MKYMLFIACFVTAALSAYQVIPVEQLSQTDFVNFEHGDIDPNIAIAFTEGFTLPLKLDLTSDFATVASDSNPEVLIKLNRTVYVRLEDSQPFFSKDLKEWKKIDKFLSGNVHFDIDKKSHQIETNFKANIK